MVYRRPWAASPKRDDLPILQNERPTRRISTALRAKRAIRTVARNWKLLVGVAVLLVIEVLVHVRSFNVQRPSTNLDPPFYTGCQEPVLNTSSRASAALVMLARNQDVDGAVGSVRSVQQQFNQHFGYPWVFLNDKQWSPEFKRRVGRAVEEGGGGATATFETISSDMWGFPDWIDREKAQQNMASMKSRGISYAGTESYHHMCRFNSGYVTFHIQRYHADWLT